MAVVCASYFGAIFAVLSNLSFRIVSQGNWLMLPCAFMGIYLALRIDGFFVVSYVGGVALLFVYALLLSFFNVRSPVSAATN